MALKRLHKELRSLSRDPLDDAFAAPAAAVCRPLTSTLLGVVPTEATSSDLPRCRDNSEYMNPTEEEVAAHLYEVCFQHFPPGIDAVHPVITQFCFPWAMEYKWQYDDSADTWNFGQENRETGYRHTNTMAERPVWTDFRSDHNARLEAFYPLKDNTNFSEAPSVDISSFSYLLRPARWSDHPGRRGAEWTLAVCDNIRKTLSPKKWSEGGWMKAVRRVPVSIPECSPPDRQQRAFTIDALNDIERQAFLHTQIDYSEVPMWADSDDHIPPAYHAPQNEGSLRIIG